MKPSPENCEVKIIVRPGKKSYISASTSYDPRPGESWRRGNDLADGPITEETLQRIFADIRAVCEGYNNDYDKRGGKLTEAEADALAELAQFSAAFGQANN